MLGSVRDRGPHARAAARRTLDLERTAQLCGALAHRSGGASSALGLPITSAAV